MKDPAFLFYPGDWTGGTLLLNRAQKGCYIDLLVAQFNNGPLTLEEIKTLLGSDFGHWPKIEKKFTFMNGRYYNPRLEIEMSKRSKFTSSRRANASSSVLAQATDKHMENVNENVLSINSLEYLRKLPETDLGEFYSIYKASKQQIQDKANALVLWCESNGKTKKNYRAFLLVALNKDFEKRPPVVSKPQITDNRAPLPKEITEKMRAITDKFKVN